MNAAAVEWALAQNVRTPGHKLVLVALAMRYKPDEAILLTKPVLDRIARIASVPRGGVRHRIEQLQRDGFLHQCDDHMRVFLHAGRAS